MKGISKYPKLTLTALQIHALYGWAEQNKDLIMQNTDMQVAGFAGAHLGFVLSANHIVQLRKQMGWAKAASPRTPSVPSSSTHVEYTDEETQVRITCIAHALVTLFQALGEDHRPACRRLQELFPGAGSVNHG